MSDPVRILLVQADATSRQFQRDLFGAADFVVEEASSGAAALEAVAMSRPDLVVLGRSLPDMDGLELLPTLKSSELDFVPVLVVSHKSETAERVRGLQLGADDYLAAPCDPAELLARAKALLRVKQTHDRIRKVQKTLEQLVVRDSLTGLHNRTHLMDRLREEMQRASRYTQPLALAMIDLDGFKPINDQFGHVVGDQVLRNVGGAIARCVRLSDIACRYGGDEFAVILPQTPPEGAMRVCERILKAIEALRLVGEQGRRTAVTASLGLAWFPADDLKTPEDFLQAADGALYAAKRSGKNRFTSVRAVGSPSSLEQAKIVA